MTKQGSKELRLSKERLYEILLAPVVSEKSTRGSEHGQVTFFVSLEATKPEIKYAVENIFKVKVKAVNTLRQKGKTKRFRGVLGQRSDKKKAIVSLVEGSNIDIAAGF